MQTVPTNQTWDSAGHFDQANEPAAFDLMGMLWRRKLLVILGVITGLGLGYLYYSTANIVYQINGQVLITSKAPAGMNQAADKLYEETSQFVGHHKTMTSPVFVESVARDHQFTKLESFRGLSNSGIVQEMLAEPNLVVIPDKDVASVYNLSYRGPVQKDLPIIMKALIDSYDDYLEERYSDVSVEQVQKVRADLGEARKNLEDTTVQYRNFQKDTELIYRNGEPFTKHQETLSEIEQRLLAANLLRDELETEQKWFKEAAAKEDTREALLEIIQKLDTKESQKLARAIEQARERQRSKQQAELEVDVIAVAPVLIDPENTADVFRLKLELEELSLKFGESHREVKQKRRQIQQWKDFQAARNEQIMEQWRAEQAARQKMKAQRDSFKQSAIADAEAENAAGIESLMSFEELDYIKVYQISLSEQLAKVESEIARWTKRQAETLKLTSRLKGDFEKDRDYRDAIERFQRDYDRVNEEYQEMNRASRRGGYNYERHSIGSDPEQVEPDLLKVMAIAGFLGTLAGCGLGYLIEIADKTFRSPSEISASLSMPLIGHVPVLGVGKSRKHVKSASQMDETVVAFHRPKSRVAEAFRAVRTAIYFNSPEQTNQIIQITSATPGDGKSTLAANLAVSIAQSGKRVLLVDADMRRPSAHFLIGIDSEIGFAQVLAGDVADPKDAYLKTEVEGLSFLPCGEKPSNPSELLTSQCLKETLENLRQDFDFVIVDTPPLLAVTDPCPVAARVDGVILAIRLKKNVKVSAERAKAMLTAVKAKTMGVVVNGVGAGNSYYQGYNATGYGGSYAYNYDAGAYSEAGDYYSDEDDNSADFVPSRDSLSSQR